MVVFTPQHMLLKCAGCSIIPVKHTDILITDYADYADILTKLNVFHKLVAACYCDQPFAQKFLRCSCCWKPLSKVFSLNSLDDEAFKPLESSVKIYIHLTIHN